MHEEAPVRVVIDLAAARIAKAMAVNLVRAVGVVQFTVEQRLAVVGPGHAAVAIVEGQGGHVAAGEILDEQSVDLVAFAIEAVGELAVVLTDAERAQGEEAAFGQLVGVEQQLFGVLVNGERAIDRAWAAIVPGVFVASRGALVIQPRPPGRRQGEVGFADAALDFLEQRLAEFGLVGELFFEIGILRLEVCQHVVGVAILQPAIGIGAGVGAGDGGVGHAVTPDSFRGR